MDFKRGLMLIGLVMVFISLGVNAYLVVDYSTSGSSSMGFGETSSTQTVGSKYDPSKSYTLTKIDFPLKKTGSPTCNVKGQIWSISGSTPINLLAESTNTISVSDLNSTFTYKEFFFEEFSITGTTDYFIGVGSDLTGCSGGNQPQIEYGTGHTGFYVTRGSSGAGWTNTITDALINYMAFNETYNITVKDTDSNELLSNYILNINITNTNQTPEGLVAGWHFDTDSSTQTDFSGNENDGTVNGATYTSDGYLNGGYGFDGTNNYIQVQNSAELELNEYTVSLWVKKIDEETGGLITKSSGTYQIELAYKNSEKFNMAFYDGVTFTQQSSPTTFNNNEWHNLIVKVDWDNKIAHMYVNGIERITEDLSALTNLKNSYRIRIGTDVNADYLNGTIDDVRIYNRSLSEKEIEILYNMHPEYHSNVNITVNNTKTYVPNITGIADVSVIKTNYITTTELNFNFSHSLELLLEGQPITDFTIISPLNNKTKETTWNIDWTDSTSPTGKQIDYNVSFYKQDNTYLDSYNTTTSSYNWNNENFTVGNFTISVCAQEHYSLNEICHNTSLTLLPTADYFKLYALHYLDDSLITNIETEIYNQTTTSNPFVESIYNHLNLSEYTNYSTVPFNITDLTYEHQDYIGSFNITRTSTEANITMEPNELVLWFYKDGSLETTQGVLHHESTINGTYAFENSSVVVLQQDLEKGYVKTKFGLIVDGNFTQYYEYINDWTTNVYEELEILTNADWSAYFRVFDQSGTPIKDATIRAEYAYSEIGNWTNFNLLGQRLTDDEGYTFFIGDSNTELLLSITKEGYAPIQKFVTLGDISTGIENAIEIYMTDSDVLTHGASWVYFDKYIYNKSLNTNGTIMAKGKSRVQIQTQYMIDNSIEKQDVTSDCDGYMNCPVTLTSGYHYTTNNDDIILYIYMDSVLWGSIVIDYQDIEEEEIFTFSGLNETYLNVILFIAIILISLFVGMIFQNIGTSFHAFTGSVLIAGLISSAYLWVFFIIVLYYILKGIRKVVDR